MKMDTQAATGSAQSSASHYRSNLPTPLWFSLGSYAVYRQFWFDKLKLAHARGAGLALLGRLVHQLALHHS